MYVNVVSILLAYNAIEYTHGSLYGKEDAEGGKLSPLVLCGERERERERARGFRLYSFFFSCYVT